MRALTLFLHPLLALTCYNVPLASAHKESKADRLADYNQNFTPRTLAELAVNRMVCSTHAKTACETWINFLDTI
jgi:hypothetical protein